MRLCDSDIERHLDEGKIVMNGSVASLVYSLKTKGVLSFLPKFYLFEIMATKA